MNKFTAIIEPDADGTLHLPLPEAWRHRAIRVNAELEPVEATSGQSRGEDTNPLKGFGCLRGKLTISPDFDEPLDDFKDYMG